MDKRTAAVSGGIAILLAISGAAFTVALRGKNSWVWWFLASVSFLGVIALFLLSALPKKHALALLVVVGLLVMMTTSVLIVVRRQEGTAPTPTPTALPCTFPGEQNLATNSSFELGTTPWKGYNSAVSSVQLSNAPEGSFVARVTRTGSDSYYSLNDQPGSVKQARPNETYRAQVFVAAATASAIGKPVTLYIRENTGDTEYRREKMPLPVMITQSFQAISLELTVHEANTSVGMFVQQDQAIDGDAIYVDNFRIWRCR